MCYLLVTLLPLLGSRLSSCSRSHERAELLWGLFMRGVFYVVETTPLSLCVSHFIRNLPEPMMRAAYLHTHQKPSPRIRLGPPSCDMGGNIDKSRM